MADDASALAHLYWCTVHAAPVSCCRHSHEVCKVAVFHAHVLSAVMHIFVPDVVHAHVV